MVQSSLVAHRERLRGLWPSRGILFGTAGTVRFALCMYMASLMLLLFSAGRQNTVVPLKGGQMKTGNRRLVESGRPREATQIQQMDLRYVSGPPHQRHPRVQANKSVCRVATAGCDPTEVCGM